jgi:hypothetical protein
LVGTAVNGLEEVDEKGVKGKPNPTLHYAHHGNEYLVAVQRREVFTTKIPKFNIVWH